MGLMELNTLARTCMSRMVCSLSQRLGLKNPSASARSDFPTSGSHFTTGVSFLLMRQMRPEWRSRRGSRKSTSPWLMIGFDQSAT